MWADQEKHVVCIAYSKDGQKHEYYADGARDKHAKDYAEGGRWCPKCNYWHGGMYVCNEPSPPVPFDEVDNDNPQFDATSPRLGGNYKFGMCGSPLRRGFSSLTGSG